MFALADDRVARVSIYIRRDPVTAAGACRRVCPVTQPVYDFSERVVVVTGGSRGVGAGIVAAFVGAGARVVACGRHEADVEGALFVMADVRKPADAERVVAKAVEHFGRLDVLVNNAAARRTPWRPTRRRASSRRWWG